MPKMPLSSEHRAKPSYEFSRLTLGKGERARVVLIDPEPQTEYVHTLRAPQLIGSEPQYEIDQKTGAKVMKYDFIGRSLCFGSFDVIADKGLDVKGCPVCKEAKSSDMVKPPERRHAVNVIRYKTQAGSFTIQDPYQVECVVWAFADKVHSDLIKHAEEWEDLRAHDLLLGPCENPTFQKFDIAVGKMAEWQQDAARKQHTLDVFKNNMLGDLAQACGRKVSREMILEDLSRVQERHAVAFGTPTGLAPLVQEINMADILGSGVPTDTQDLLGGDPPFETPPVSEGKISAGAQSPGALMNLDDILAL